MHQKITIDEVFSPSDDVVAREIEGEIILIPLAKGIGDSEGELYTLNGTGKAIWDRLDGQRSLRDVIRELSAEFQADEGQIGADVVGLLGELVRRKMVVAVA